MNMVVEEKYYSVQEVFDMIPEQYLLGDDVLNKSRASDLEVDGFKVHAVSLRYKTFYQKGCKCAVCGKEGTYFRLCGDENTNRRHFNLYADDGTLITKDHIIPKSRGGQDLVSNMQPMCKTCNSIKGNDSIEGNKIEYIVIYRNDKMICKFRELDKAIKYVVMNFCGVSSNKIDKTCAVKTAVCCTIKVLKALENNTIAYGCRFTREAM